MSLISLSCLIALARTPFAILNESGKTLFLILRRKKFSLLHGDVCATFFKDALWEKSGYEGHTKYLISNVIGGVWKTQF